MPINKAMMNKTRKQRSKDTFNASMRNAQFRKKPKLYRVKSKWNKGYLPTPVTLDEFTSRYGAAARGYTLTPIN